MKDNNPEKTNYQTTQIISEQLKFKFILDTYYSTPLRRT